MKPQQISRKIKFSIYEVCIFVLVFLFNIEHTYIIASNEYIVGLLSDFEWIFYFILICLIARNNKYKVKQLFTISIGVILLSLVYFFSSYTAPLKMLILITATKNKDYQKVLSVILKAYFFSFLLTIILYLSGISNGGIQRRGFSAIGYTSPNVAGGYTLVMFLIWLYKRNTAGKIKKIWFNKINMSSKVKYVFAVIISMLTYIIINNRTVVLLLLLTPFIFICIKQLTLKKANTLLSTLIMIMPILFIALSYISAMLYPKSTIIQELNLFVNHRIVLNYRNLVNHGVPFLGQHVVWNTGEMMYNEVTGTYSTYNTVDNSYICLMIQMGIVSTFLYILAHILVVKKAFRNNDICLITIIIIIGIYGLIESSILESFINFPMLYLLSSNNSYYVHCVTARKKKNNFWANCNSNFKYI